MLNAHCLPRVFILTDFTTLEHRQPNTAVHTTTTMRRAASLTLLLLAPAAAQQGAYDPLDTHHPDDGWGGGA